ncbi:MAG: response regulator [Thermoanaerobaculaceae bacterium]|jgi:CheY-like chemotaxis protein|nr:response regulator [Thermoanaerobaculaceae bacterium]
MGSTILLADDSITIQKVVELTFGETDHRVVAVSSGRELLRRVPEVQPDVILCDVVMPDLNGYEVCQTLKADPVTLHLPVVLLTGTFEPFDRDRAIASGCDAIVTKPFEGRELVSVVEDLLRRSRSVPVAEPEPSFFPGLGAPEGMPGLEFTTTGFDQMVPQPAAEPGIPEHGIEMTGVSPRPPEATEVDEGFAFGGPHESAAASTPASAGDADDSWIDRVGTEAPAVGSMQGEFFTTPSDEPAEGAAAAGPPEVERGEAMPVRMLQPWEEAAELQGTEPPAPEAAPPAMEPGSEAPSAGFQVAAAAEVPAFPEPKAGPAFSDAPPIAPWGESEAAEEPEAGLWPSTPAPPEVPVTLGSLNPARESVASAWTDEELAQPAQSSAEPEGTAPEPGFVHPEPGFPFGAPAPVPAPEGQPAEAVLAEVSAPGTEELEEAPAEEPASARTPAPGTDVVLDEGPAEEPAPAGEEEAPEPAELAEAEMTVEAGIEPSVPTPSPEGTEAPPAEPAEAPAPEVVAAIEELAAVAPAPIEEGPAPEPEPAAAAQQPTPAPAVTITDELIELIADRVLAHLPPPELGEDHVLAVAHRAAQLIPPPPPPDIPPLSYELEEADIQRVARRVLEILPPPPPPEPVRLSDDEVEYVAQRVLALIPPPEPQPVVVPQDEVQRITEHVLASMTAPPPPELPDSELSRVADRVLALLPPPPEPAPPQAAAELSEAAIDQVAHKVLELATPLIEKIAWDVIPDMAEMLVRRRIEELERDAES